MDATMYLIRVPETYFLQGGICVGLLILAACAMTMLFRLDRRVYAVPKSVVLS